MAKRTNTDGRNSLRLKSLSTANTRCSRRATQTSSSTIRRRRTRSCRVRWLRPRSNLVSTWCNGSACQSWEGKRHSGTWWSAIDQLKTIRHSELSLTLTAASGDTPLSSGPTGELPSPSVQPSSEDGPFPSLPSLPNLPSLPALPDLPSDPADSDPRIQALLGLRGPSNFPSAPSRAPQPQGPGPAPRRPGQGFGIPGYDDARDDDLDSWCCESKSKVDRCSEHVSAVTGTPTDSLQVYVMPTRACAVSTATTCTAPHVGANTAKRRVTRGRHTFTGSRLEYSM